MKVFVYDQIEVTLDANIHSDRTEPEIQIAQDSTPSHAIPTILSLR